MPEHGKDTFVPLRMTMENYKACTGPKELVIIDETAHAQSFWFGTGKMLTMKGLCEKISIKMPHK